MTAPSEEKCGALFASVNSILSKGFVFLSPLAGADNGGADGGERCFFLKRSLPF